MHKIELTYFQMILIGMGVGLVLGLIPLILGIVKGKRKLAIWGFVASIAAGAAWSVLSLITVIVFIWLILRKPSEAKPVQDEIVNENPIDVSVEDSENSSENQI
jgi:Na+/melibiose symporter-like transporter